MNRVVSAFVLTIVVAPGLASQAEATTASKYEEFPGLLIPFHAGRGMTSPQEGGAR